MTKRAFITMSLLMVLTFVLPAFAPAQAQDDRTPITLGEWVQGTITAENYQTKYVLTGKKGDVVTVLMVEASNNGNLDAMLVLRTSDGDILAQNDDIPPHHSLVMAELPADGDYVILATRLNGKDGDTEGDYWIQANIVQPMQTGEKTSL